MLAPLAVAVTLGLSQQAAALAAPYKLGVNGNMLVMASDFAKALEPDVAARLSDPLGTAHDFAAAIGLWHQRRVRTVQSSSERMHTHQKHLNPRTLASKRRTRNERNMSKTRNAP